MPAVLRINSRHGGAQPPPSNAFNLEHFIFYYRVTGSSTCQATGQVGQKDVDEPSYWTTLQWWTNKLNLNLI